MKRPLPGDPRYLIGSDGVIYGLRGTPLKPWIQNGYQKVRLAGRVKWYVHDAVARTFIGPKPKGGCVRHGLGGPLDNSVSNLRYGSYSDNEYDKVAHGTHQQASKTHCSKGHEFTEANTRVYTGRGYHERQCRTCANEASRLNKARKRAA